MQTQAMTEWTALCLYDPDLCEPRKPKPFNTRSQATRRREVRRRSNLPRAIQKRLGFKCH